MYLKKVLLSASVLFMPALCSAYLVNGNILLDDLEKHKPVASGYIEGVSDSLNKSFFCIPPGTGTSKLREVVYEYISNQPERLQLTGSKLVTEALGKTWPC